MYQISILLPVWIHIASHRHPFVQFWLTQSHELRMCEPGKITSRIFTAVLQMTA